MRHGRPTRFQVEYTPEAIEHLRGLGAAERSGVLDAVDRQLTHEPTTPTRNRKLLRANPVAPWELRIGHLRVYFDVKGAPGSVVTVRAIGRKVRSQVLIGGEEVDLG
jgi:mRNA-degrading endonuclease RelE of RelBE toxin-antitoxin system